MGPLHCELIKIDVEVHEAPVSDGARKLLERDRAIVMIEMNAGRASERTGPKRVWSQMLDLGFRWYELSNDLGAVTRCHSPGSGVNLFAIHDPRNLALVRCLLSGATS